MTRLRYVDTDMYCFTVEVWGCNNLHENVTCISVRSGVQVGHRTRRLGEQEARVAQNATEFPAG